MTDVDSIKIHSHFKDYTVCFTDSLSDITEVYEKQESFFVMDRKIVDLYQKDLKAETLPVNQNPFHPKNMQLKKQQEFEMIL